MKRAKGKVGATPRIRNACGPVSEGRLLQWLKEPLNYECWKCSPSTDSSGRKNTGGKRKIDVCHEIVECLQRYGIMQWIPEQIRSKVKGLETSWRNAQGYLIKTGKGLSDEEKRANLSINGKLYLRSNSNLLVGNLFAVHFFATSILLYGLESPG